MNRWQALVEIVKSFNDNGAPKLAFGVVCAFVVIPLIVGAFVAYKFGYSIRFPVGPPG